MEDVARITQGQLDPSKLQCYNDTLVPIGYPISRGDWPWQDFDKTMDICKENGSWQYVENIPYTSHFVEKGTIIIPTITTTITTAITTTITTTITPSISTTIMIQVHSMAYPPSNCGVSPGVWKMRDVRRMRVVSWATCIRV